MDIGAVVPTTPLFSLPVEALGEGVPGEHPLSTADLAKCNPDQSRCGRRDFLDRTD